MKKLILTSALATSLILTACGSDSEETSVKGINVDNGESNMTTGLTSYGPAEDDEELSKREEHDAIVEDLDTNFYVTGKLLENDYVREDESTLQNKPKEVIKEEIVTKKDKKFMDSIVEEFNEGMGIDYTRGTLLKDTYMTDIEFYSGNYEDMENIVSLTVHGGFLEHVRYESEWENFLQVTSDIDDKINKYFDGNYDFKIKTHDSEEYIARYRSNELREDHLYFRDIDLYEDDYDPNAPVTVTVPEAEETKDDKRVPSGDGEVWLEEVLELGDISYDVYMEELQKDLKITEERYYELVPEDERSLEFENGTAYRIDE